MFTVAWHPTLISLLIWLVVKYGDKVLLTSAFRKGDTGVHGQDPLRGFDLRSLLFDDPQAVCEEVNKVWIYDPDRPEKKVAMWHNIGQGWHFHFQIHPKTIYNQKED